MDRVPPLHQDMCDSAARYLQCVRSGRQSLEFQTPCRAQKSLDILRLSCTALVFFPSARSGQPPHPYHFPHPHVSAAALATVALSRLRCHHLPRPRGAFLSVCDPFPSDSSALLPALKASGDGYAGCSKPNAPSALGFLPHSSPATSPLLAFPLPCR